MWWSQADAATYRSWFQHAGLTITGEDFIAEGAGGHTLFSAQRSTDLTTPRTVPQRT